MPTIATIRPAAGPPSLQQQIRSKLTATAAPVSLRARIAVDLIERHLEREHPELLELPRDRRWAVPAHLIHPSLREVVSA